MRRKLGLLLLGYVLFASLFAVVVQPVSAQEHRPVVIELERLPARACGGGGNWASRVYSGTCRRSELDFFLVTGHVDDVGWQIVFYSSPVDVYDDAWVDLFVRLEVEADGETLSCTSLVRRSDATIDNDWLWNHRVCVGTGDSVAADSWDSARIHLSGAYGGYEPESECSGYDNTVWHPAPLSRGAPNLVHVFFVPDNGSSDLADFNFSVPGAQYGVLAKGRTGNVNDPLVLPTGCSLYVLDVFNRVECRVPFMAFFVDVLPDQHVTGTASLCPHIVAVSVASRTQPYYVSGLRLLVRPTGATFELRDLPEEGFDPYSFWWVHDGHGVWYDQRVNPPSCMNLRTQELLGERFMRLKVKAGTFQRYYEIVQELRGLAFHIEIDGVASEIEYPLPTELGVWDEASGTAIFDFGSWPEGVNSNTWVSLLGPRMLGETCDEAVIEGLNYTGYGVDSVECKVFQGVDLFVIEILNATGGLHASISVSARTGGSSVTFVWSLSYGASWVDKLSRIGEVGNTRWSGFGIDLVGMQYVGQQTTRDRYRNFKFTSTSTFDWDNVCGDEFDEEDVLVGSDLDGDGTIDNDELDDVRDPGFSWGIGWYQGTLELSPNSPAGVVCTSQNAPFRSSVTIDEGNVTGLLRVTAAELGRRDCEIAGTQVPGVQFEEMVTQLGKTVVFTLYGELSESEFRSLNVVEFRTFTANAWLDMSTCTYTDRTNSAYPKCVVTGGYTGVCDDMFEMVGSVVRGVYRDGLLIPDTVDVCTDVKLDEDDNPGDVIIDPTVPVLTIDQEVDFSTVFDHAFGRLSGCMRTWDGWWTVSSGDDEEADYGDGFSILDPRAWWNATRDGVTAGFKYVVEGVMTAASGVYCGIVTLFLPTPDGVFQVMGIVGVGQCSRSGDMPVGFMNRYWTDDDGDGIVDAGEASDFLYRFWTDRNGNGVIDDGEFSGTLVSVWTDDNGNGVVDHGELKDSQSCDTVNMRTWMIGPMQEIVNDRLPVVDAGLESPSQVISSPYDFEIANVKYYPPCYGPRLPLGAAFSGLRQQVAQTNANDGVHLDTAGVRDTWNEVFGDADPYNIVERQGVPVDELNELNLLSLCAYHGDDENVARRVADMMRPFVQAVVLLLGIVAFVTLMWNLLLAFSIDELGTRNQRAWFKIYFSAKKRDYKARYVERTDMKRANRKRKR